MSHENWHPIWSKRGVTDASALSIEALIRLDGYDTGAAQIAIADWLFYAKSLAERIDIRDGQSIFEVGCGAGAFLSALTAARNVSVGGIDYSSGLVENARQALPTGQFFVGDAELLAREPATDFVIANGVFHYFPLPKARAILKLMLAKAEFGVAVLDIPDRRSQAECEAVRRAALPAAEYERKYAGLEHTYYDRDWFADQVTETDWQCETVDGFIPNYGQNRFRFAALYRRAQTPSSSSDRI